MTAEERKRFSEMVETFNTLPPDKQEKVIWFIKGMSASNDLKK